MVNLFTSLLRALYKQGKQNSRGESPAVHKRKQLLAVFLLKSHFHIKNNVQILLWFSLYSVYVHAKELMLRITDVHDKFSC